jgi:GGDEF domain-containing protein
MDALSPDQPLSFQRQYLDAIRTNRGEDRDTGLILDSQLRQLYYALWLKSLGFLLLFAAFDPFLRDRLPYVLDRLQGQLPNDDILARYKRGELALISDCTADRAYEKALSIRESFEAFGVTVRIAYAFVTPQGGADACVARFDEIRDRFHAEPLSDKSQIILF